MKKVFAFLSTLVLTIALVGVFAVNNPAKAADKFTEDPTLLDDEIAVYIMDSIMTTFPNYYDNDAKEDPNWQGTARMYPWNETRLRVAQLDESGQPTGKYYAVYFSGHTTAVDTNGEPIIGAGKNILFYQKNEAGQVIATKFSDGKQAANGAASDPSLSHMRTNITGEDIEFDPTQLGLGVVMKNRNSSFELMRIVSMIFIVIGHTLSWGGVTDSANDFLKLIIYIIYALIVVHVNSFVLLTGYYQVQSKFKIKKVINILILMLFYRIFCLIIAINLDWIQYVGIKDLILKILPLSNFSYWYLNVYIVLYLISPYLNVFVNNTSKKKYGILLIILFIFCSIITRTTMQEFIANEDGYSLIHFIFMYLVGGYLRKYDGTINFKVLNKKITTMDKSSIFLIIYFIIGIIKFLFNYLGINNNILPEFVNIRLKYSFDRLIYDDPLVILQSISYFLFFKNLKIKSSAINTLSLATNEVYLFHMNQSFRKNLYLMLGLNLSNYTIKNVPKIIWVVMQIYFIGIIIFFVRTFIIKTISDNKYIMKVKEKVEKKCNIFDEMMNT